MRSNIKLVVCLSTAFLAVSAYAQDRNSSATPDATAIRPVAYVYVSNQPKNSSTNEVIAYSAGPHGRLTPIVGSPFREDVGEMAVDGQFLFADNLQSPDIGTYRIEPDGALTYITSTNYAQYNLDDCGTAGPLFSDHTGFTLYVMESNGNACANNVYASFSVDKSNGALNYLGKTVEGAPTFGAPYLAPAFVGDNVFAYTATNAASMYFETTGLERTSSGMLTNIQNFQVTFPAPPEGARVYIPQQAAADRTSHVAMTLQAANPPGENVGKPQLVSFLVHTNGDLTTTNTSADMPATQVSFANDLKMSPTGELLAVGGTGGLQVFHFNGTQPMTKYTPLLTTETIAQMFWDNDNHLYAITQGTLPAGTGKLFVFTITPTGYSQAPGSPYTIYDPQALAIQSLPLPR
jgi:hypothetical protein